MPPRRGIGRASLQADSARQSSSRDTRRRGTYVRGCRRSRSETSRRKCVKRHQDARMHLKQPSERPKVSYSVLKASPSLLNARQVRVVLLDAKAATFYNSDVSTRGLTRRARSAATASGAGSALRERPSWTRSRSPRRGAAARCRGRCAACTPRARWSPCPAPPPSRSDIRSKVLNP
jgi:hypothetical protein